MGTDSEYRSLCSQRNSAESQRAAANNTIEECQYKIRRLQNAKETLAAQKGAFKTLKNTDKETIESKGSDWIGQNFKDFQSKGNELMTENDNYYTNSLDAALDAINNEITRLQNMIYEKYGLIGRLTSWINSLSNKIENFFN